MSVLTLIVSGQKQAGKTALIHALTGALGARGVEATFRRVANTETTEIVEINIANPEKLAEFAANPFPPNNRLGLVCKGSMKLGTGCGGCARCRDEIGL